MFLTKKEQTLIKLLNANTALKATERNKMIDEIKYKARLRKDGYKRHVREFLQALAAHNSNKILKAIS